MNNKKLSWDEINKMRDEFMKNPNFRKAVKEFIKITSK